MLTTGPTEGPNCVTATAWATPQAHVGLIHPNGEFIYRYEVGTTYQTSLARPRLDDASNLYLAGRTSEGAAIGATALSPEDGPAAFLISLDPTGEPRWHQAFPADESLAFRQIEWSHGALFATVGFRGLINLGGGTLGYDQEGSAVALASFHERDGTHRWSSVVGRSPGPRLARRAGGGVWACGVASSEGALNFNGYTVTSNDTDGYLIEMNEDGDVLRHIRFDGPGHQGIYAIATSSAGVVVAGSFVGRLEALGRMYTGGTEGFLARFSPSGELVWLRIIDVLSSGIGLAMDEKGLVYATAEPPEADRIDDDERRGPIVLDPIDDVVVSIVTLDTDGSLLRNDLFRSDGEVNIGRIDSFPTGALVLGGTYTGDLSFDTALPRTRFKRSFIATLGVR